MKLEIQREVAVFKRSCRWSKCIIIYILIMLSQTQILKWLKLIKVKEPVNMYYKNDSLLMYRI